MTTPTYQPPATSALATKVQAARGLLSDVTHEIAMKSREWHGKLVDVSNLLCSVEMEVKKGKIAMADTSQPQGITPDVRHSSASRTAFEEWLPKRGYLCRLKEDGRYDSSHTQIMWDAWHAAWNTRTPATPAYEEVSVAEFSGVISTVALCISSTRRSGTNGLRNPGELYQALRNAKLRIVKEKAHD